MHTSRISASGSAASTAPSEETPAQKLQWVKGFLAEMNQPDLTPAKMGEFVTQVRMMQGQEGMLATESVPEEVVRETLALLPQIYEKAEEFAHSLKKNAELTLAEAKSAIEELGDSSSETSDATERDALMKNCKELVMQIQNELIPSLPEDLKAELRLARQKLEDLYASLGGTPLMPGGASSSSAALSLPTLQAEGQADALLRSLQEFAMLVTDPSYDPRALRARLQIEESKASFISQAPDVPFEKIIEMTSLLDQIRTALAHTALGEERSAGASSSGGGASSSSAAASPVQQFLEEIEAHQTLIEEYLENGCERHESDAALTKIRSYYDAQGELSQSGATPEEQATIARQIHDLENAAAYLRASFPMPVDPDGGPVIAAEPVSCDTIITKLTELNTRIEEALESSDPVNIASMQETLLDQGVALQSLFDTGDFPARLEELLALQSYAQEGLTRLQSEAPGE